MTKALAAVVQFGRDANRLIADWLTNKADDHFRAAHRPEKLGPVPPYENLVCLRCEENWPCAEMRRFADELDARKERRP